MSIKHGVFIEEEQVVQAAPTASNSSIQVVIGTAPVNMAADPSAVVNVPILAKSAAEAKKLLGYSDDFRNYSLCQSMYVTENLYPMKPVVYINVLDPATHKKALTEASYQVSEMQATVNVVGVILSSLVVKDATKATTLVKGTDYTTAFGSKGYLVITMVAGGAGASLTSVSVSGDMLDPSKVKNTDIIGTYDIDTGVETGIQLVRQVYPKLGVIPGILLAPEWSQNADVAAALIAKATIINGVFKGIALIDIDTTVAKKYTDVEAAKKAANLTSPFAYALWPCDKIGDYIFAKSAVVGSLIAYIDANDDDVPSRSPSNHLIGVTAECLKDGTEIFLDQEQGTTVNSYGVATVINMNGFRLWGNYTCAYPSSIDPKEIWLAVRRMFNWHGNSFITAYFNKVDDPMNSVLIESVVDSENIRCAAYAPDKWAGASIEYRSDDNPTEDILAGKMVFRQKIAPYTPAQEIENILSYDTDLLQSAITGGGN